MSSAPYKSFVCCIACVLLTQGCGDADSSSMPQIKTSATPQDESGTDVTEFDRESAVISDRVDQFFRAISSGQVEHAYDVLTAPRFRKVATAEQFTSHCDRLNTRLGSLRSTEESHFNLESVDGTFIASATYQATFDLGAGTLFVIFQKIDEKWLLLRLNVNAPELLDDPKAFQQRTELYVENSEPVPPGAMVDLWDIDEKPPKMIIENVLVLNVRWKVENPFKRPEAPANGFVTIGLTADQTKIVESSGTLSVRPHKP